MLIRKAQKARFSQDKYRRSFIAEVSNVVCADEIVLAHTFGPNEWYIVTTQRLLICGVNTGLWLGTKRLKGVQRVIQLDSITKLTSFSEPWLQHGKRIFGPPAGPLLMNLQIETFGGDLKLCVYASEDDAPHYSDPYYWLDRLEEAVGLVEEGRKHPICILYTLGVDTAR